MRQVLWGPALSLPKGLQQQLGWQALCRMDVHARSPLPPMLPDSVCACTCTCACACAEAVNFAMPSWLPAGKAAVPCTCGCLREGVRLDMGIFCPELRRRHSDDDDDDGSESEESEEEESESEAESGGHLSVVVVVRLCHAALAAATGCRF